MKNTTGIDLSDAVLVDSYLAGLQGRVEMAERLLATNLTAESEGAEPAPLDMASAGRVAAMFRQSTPAQRNAVISKRREQVGEDQLRRELGAIATASRDEYAGILARSGLRYGNRR